MNQPLNQPRRVSVRRGATLVLVAVMSTVLVSLGALVINWSYIELTNTQLRSATDAAAKAAAVALRETQSQNQARNAAKQLIREFTVGGQQMQISNEDIEFGNARKEANGSYTFNTDEEPTNCARVTARCGNGGATGSVQVFFSNIVSPGSYDLQKQAIAGRYDHDVCIVLDRSGSMAWDLTGDEFSYPSVYHDDSTLQNYFRPPYLGYDDGTEAEPLLSETNLLPRDREGQPHTAESLAAVADPNKRQSRWGAALRALEVFRTTIDDRDLKAKVGLASFASDYTFGFYNATKVSQDQQLNLDTQLFLDAAHEISEDPLIGDTTIAAGINHGRQVIRNTDHRRNLTSERTMILLCDGAFGGGLKGNAVRQAERAANQRVTIYTIGYGPDDAGSELLEEIATTTGGVFYPIDLGSSVGASYEQLVAAFEDIAARLPGSLIQ